MGCFLFLVEAAKQKKQSAQKKDAGCSNAFFLGGHGGKKMRALGEKNATCIIYYVSALRWTSRQDEIGKIPIAEATEFKALGFNHKRHHNNNNTTTNNNK